jgi:hypothetical protein
MRLSSALCGILMAAAPSICWAQDAPNPKYPPGFDCSAVPAGSQRQACQESQFNPANDATKGQAPSGGVPPTPGTVSPPTVPDQPSGENGSSGAATGSGSDGAGTGNGQ